MLFQFKAFSLLLIALFWPVTALSLSYSLDSNGLRGLAIYEDLGLTSITYQLQRDRGVLLDEAQALIMQGEGVSVNHVLNISTQDIDFDRDFDVQVFRYAKFDKMNETVLCGESENLLKPMADEVALASCLFDVQRVPIDARGRGLDTGVNYKVDVYVVVSPITRKKSFWNFLNPVTYFDKSVTVETTYIGR